MRLNYEIARLRINPELIGVLLFGVTCIGTVLAVVGNLQSWSIYQQCKQEQVLGVTATNCETVVLQNQDILTQPLKGYRLIRSLQSSADIKNTGLAIALTAGCLSLILNGQIAETLLKQEEEEHALAEREETLKEKEQHLEDSVEERMLKLNYALKVKEFEELLQLPLKPEFADKEKEKDYFDDEGFGVEGESKEATLNADKLLAWLLQKNIKESSVSELSRASIYGKHWEVETLRTHLDQLTQAGAVKWLNEEKTRFTMLFSE